MVRCCVILLEFVLAGLGVLSNAVVQNAAAVPEGRAKENVRPRHGGGGRSPSVAGLRHRLLLLPQLPRGFTKRGAARPAGRSGVGQAGRAAVPGHRQPKVPAWGHADEADPAVMAKKIDAAADNGIDAFIFDWYFYDDGPFLDRCLNEGFLKAPNNSRISSRSCGPTRLGGHPAGQARWAPLQYPGKITPATFDRMTDHIIKDYFRHPSYWKIDGRRTFRSTNSIAS